MRIAVEEITPELAEEFLGHNLNNRHARQAAVNAMARDIIRGDWKVTGDPIKFDTNGTLVDGQHRLLAIIAAETPAVMAVAYDVDPDAQPVIDTGSARTFADTLRMKGVPSAAVIAAATRKAMLFEADQFTAGGSLRITRQELLRFYTENTESLTHACRVADVVAHALPSGCLTLSGTAVAVRELYSIDTDDAEDFIARLKSGEGLYEGDPIYTLRRWWMAQAASSRVGGYSATLERARLACVFKAWNGYRTGATMQALTFRAGGSNPEKFPERV